MAVGQVEADLIGQALEPTTDLEEQEPECVELQARHAPLEEPAAQGVQEPVGGGMQEQAELVGPEVMVAQAIGRQSTLKSWIHCSLVPR